MKVTLINPPSPFLQDERVFPYLGILSVATSLRTKGHSVNVVDLSGDLQWQKTTEKLPKADIYGATSTTSQYKYAHRIGQILKGRGKTIIGGTHVNNLPANDTVNQEDLKVFDVVYKGEGEGFLELDGRINEGRLVKSLDDLEIPDRRFFDMSSYHFTLNGRTATTLLTQRGCPFTCVFCSGRDNDMYKKSRQHSPERVVKEMDELHKRFGYSAFMWFDDEVNINPSRLEEIAQRLKGKDYIHRGFLRSDLLVKHPETIDYLKQMGFVEVGIGVESGSNDVLKRIHKGTTTQTNDEAIQRLKAAGIRVKAFTMIGHPGETEKEVIATKEFLLKSKPNGFDISMMQPYPGSILYRDAKPSSKYKMFDVEYNGLYFSKPRFSQESLWHKGTPGMYHSIVRTDELSSERLVELQSKLEKELRRKLK